MFRFSLNSQPFIEGGSQRRATDATSPRDTTIAGRRTAERPSLKNREAFRGLKIGPRTMRVAFCNVIIYLLSASPVFDEARRTKRRKRDGVTMGPISISVQPSVQNAPWITAWPVESPSRAAPVVVVISSTYVIRRSPRWTSQVPTPRHRRDQRVCKILRLRWRYIERSRE